MYKLGRLKDIPDARTLKLANYLDAALLPTPPAAYDISKVVANYPMYGNDSLGDCTCAAAGHMIQLWNALKNKSVTPSLQDIVSVYKKLSPNDEGCRPLDVLRYWRKSGFGGHKLHAFAWVQPSNIAHVELSMWLLGGVYVAIELPYSASAQVGKLWDVPADGLKGPGAPGTWGGHMVNLLAYDAQGLIVATWGKLQRMTWAFWRAYVDDCYALLTEDWAQGAPLGGVNFAGLYADLKRIGTEINVKAAA